MYINTLFLSFNDSHIEMCKLKMYSLFSQKITTNQHNETFNNNNNISVKSTYFTGNNNKNHHIKDHSLCLRFLCVCASVRISRNIFQRLYSKSSSFLFPLICAVVVVFWFLLSHFIFVPIYVNIFIYYISVTLHPLSKNQMSFETFPSLFYTRKYINEITKTKQKIRVLVDTMTLVPSFVSFFASRFVSLPIYNVVFI